MKAQDFKKHLDELKILQAETDTIVTEAVIRKFGGGRGREIKTLNISLSLAHRPGMHIPAYAWMNTVCQKFNQAIRHSLIDEKKSLNGATSFAIDAQTVRVIVKGTTLKVSANMEEKE